MEKKKEEEAEEELKKTKKNRYQNLDGDIDPRANTNSGVSLIIYTPRSFTNEL